MSQHLSGPTARDFPLPYPVVPETDLIDFVRLTREVMSVLLALPVQLDGRDNDVEHFAAFYGLKRSDAIILPIRWFNRQLVLVIARTQVWRAAKKKLLALKQTSAFANRRVVLIPAGRIRRAVFLSNCALIASSASTAASATIRMAIIEQLMADPASSLRECATSIGAHMDPVGAVLSLVARGFLRLNLQTPISPETLVSLA